MLALLYDVHGNLPALEAVLEDSPTDRFLLGGDYAVAGAWPRETVERLDTLDAQWIRGNADRWLVDAHDAPEGLPDLIEACRRSLGDGLVERLAGLPESTTIEGTLYCHASPQSDMESFFPDPRDEDAELLLGVETERVVFGHTHTQFQREGPASIHLVNPGSVGMPWDGDHDAAYAILNDDGTVELRRVEYDWRAYATVLRQRVGELPAKRIEQARFDVG